MIDKKEFGNDLTELKCPCGGIMKQVKVRLYGHSVRGWKCKKCGELTVDSMESDRVRQQK